ncbi:MAG: hypothetical protein JNJ63_05815 [Hyphomonadaceae bacterium]|nr:hypothetical protein [Hyphomonadaceae bacterium]
MGSFFSAMFAEIGARRRRLRASLGDRGQAIVEFLVLGGLMVGSVGLFVRAWMPAAAPWGFWLPLVFVAGFLLIEARRQAAAARAEAPAKLSASYDWYVFLWSFACALSGAAAFVIAYTAQPPAPEEPQGWAPPESAVSVDISP